MSIRVRANASITTNDRFTNGDRDDALARIVATINAHCIVHRSSIHPTGSEGVAVVSVTFSTANMVEAKTILAEALQATGHPHDAEEITIL